MGELDITEKTLESFTDVFADMVNAAAFDGEQIVRPEDLSPALPRSQLKFSDGIHEQERDTAMFWRSSTLSVAVLGLENQTHVDVNMPPRVLAYDGSFYKELLQKGLPLQPVVTFVFYFGWKKRWDGPRSLLECFDVPGRLRPFVQDYSINVIETAFLDDEHISMFRSDIRFVAEFLRAQRLGKVYEPKRDDKISHVHEVLQFFQAMTKDNRFEQVYNAELMKDGEFTMCEMLDMIENRGYARGSEHGYDRMGELIGEFMRNNRLDDLRRIGEDKSYRDRVMRERFGV